MLCPNGHENGPTNTYCVDCGVKLGSPPPSGESEQPVSVKSREGDDEASAERTSRHLKPLSIVALIAAVAFLAVASVIVLRDNDKESPGNAESRNADTTGDSEPDSTGVYVDVIVSDLDGDLTGESIQVTDESGRVIGETYIEPVDGYSLDSGVRNLSVFTEPTQSSTVQISITDCKGPYSTYLLDVAGDVGLRRTFSPEESGQADTYEYVSFETGFLVSDRRPLTCETFGNAS